MTDEQEPSLRGWGTVAVLTALYWTWESQAEGNIRVDLLLIYPVLLGCYLYNLWPRFRLWSILIAAALMAMNVYFFAISYRLFGKNVG